MSTVYFYLAKIVRKLNLFLFQTYNVDRQVPDSAGTATAMMSGVKTRFGVVGVNKNVIAKDCQSVAGNELDTMMDWSKEKGNQYFTIAWSAIGVLFLQDKQKDNQTKTIWFPNFIGGKTFGHLVRLRICL